MASGVLNVLSDFSILILPTQRVWRLQISNEKKRYITGVFSLGLLACVASILRLICSICLLDEIMGTAAFQLLEDRAGLSRYGIASRAILSYPILFGTYKMLIRRHLSIAELSLGIIVSCLPILPRFFKQAFIGKLSPTFKLRPLLFSKNSDTGMLWSTA